jgi:hypothetical protein
MAFRREGEEFTDSGDSKLLPLSGKAVLGKREAFQMENAMTKKKPPVDWYPGTFIACCRDDSDMQYELSADDVIDWDDPPKEEVSFKHTTVCWVSLALLGQNVKAEDLVVLRKLMTGLGGERHDAMIQIAHARICQGKALSDITVKELEADRPTIFWGETRDAARKAAAESLFLEHWRDLYTAWKSDMDGLVKFDWEECLRKPLWKTWDCVAFGSHVVLVTLA